MKDKDVNSRYLIIMHGIKTGNVSETCKLFGISRTTYYKWYERYKECGVEGLRDKKRAKPKMPNEISKEVEDTILELVIQNPKDGPRRLSYDLNDIGIDISDMGVYNVLKRNGLNLMEDRMQFAKKYGYISKSKFRKSLISLDTIKNSHPGFALQQGTSYIGKLNNIGKVYMISIVDCYSYFTIAKIYKNKRYANVNDFIETKLIPITKAFDIKIENIVTNGSGEYYNNWGKGKHKYSQLLSKYDINQIVIPASEDTDINFLKHVNSIVYEEFYKSILENNNCCFQELQGNLQRFMTYYNFKREINEECFKGKTPIEVFTNKLDGEYQIPTWFFVNSINF